MLTAGSGPGLHAVCCVVRIRLAWASVYPRLTVNQTDARDQIVFQNVKILHCDVAKF